MASTTVLGATRELMRQLGLTTVFGNPGTTEVPFLAEWPDDFRYVLGLQESVVVAMADAYAQLTGQAVLVNLHSAGGVGHGLGSVFTACRNHAPVIVLAGQQARPLLGEQPFLGATDAPRFPHPYVKWSHEPALAGEVPTALVRAYRHAMQPPRGPVFLSVPVDDWDAPIEAPRRSALAPIRGFAPHPDAVAEVAAALTGCARGALVLGAGVDADGAVGAVIWLAERTGAAVWAAPLSGRCSFPEDHRLFCGFLPPERGALAAALTGYDLLLVLGAPAFTYHVLRDTPVPPLPETFVVSDDPDVLARAPHGRGVLSSVGPAIVAFLAALPVTPPRPTANPRPGPPRPAATRPMTAAFFYHTLARLLPADAVVVEEAPSHRGALHDHLPIRTHGGGFLTTAGGALGYGVAATVGAALARPTATVVGVLGDGSVMYGVQALWTAARESANATFVVLDNAEYAAVRVLGEAAGGRKLPGVTLGGIDFVALAHGMGCRARRVEDPADLAAALTAAWTAPGPTLLHVPVDTHAPVPY